jgi:hypothetical protein
MRQEQQPIAAALSAVDFKFRFEMTNAGTRHDCSVIIQAVNFHDAAAVFRANWPTIENLALRSLAANDLSDIRLEVALAYQGAEQQPSSERLRVEALRAQFIPHSCFEKVSGRAV